MQEFINSVQGNSKFDKLVPFNRGVCPKLFEYFKRTSEPNLN